MKKEIEVLREQLIQNYDGDPWYGRALMNILTEVTNKNAWGAAIYSEHNNTVLLNHLLNWRLFTISRFDDNAAESMHLFEDNNWPVIPNPTKEAWLDAIDKLKLSQQKLLQVLDNTTDDILDKKVPGRDYDFRYLLNGIIQHDIYHVGQIVLTVK